MTPDFQMLAERGAHFFEGYGDPVFTNDAWKSDFNLAMDAQPALTTAPNSGIPQWLTTFIDPTIINVLFSPLKAAKIFGEVKKGDWLMQTALFPIVEYTGEVSSYGDFNENGRTGLNTDFPNRQSYLYQIIKEYGELEMERAGLARIAWAAELDKAAINILNRFQNNTYFFGVQGLQNYGGLNDPNLSASLTPSAKAAGGVTWFTPGGSPNATANEVYNDILSIYEQLVIQAGGVVELDMEQTMVLAMSPAVQVALDFTNTYGITTRDMLRKAFPNMRMETAVQYGVQTTANTPGIVAGNLVQLIAENAGGQDTCFCAFNEKLRTHKIVIALSSFKQKATQGTWGTVIRQPYAIASMLGV